MGWGVPAPRGARGRGRAGLQGVRAVWELGRAQFALCFGSIQIRAGHPAPAAGIPRGARAQGCSRGSKSLCHHGHGCGQASSHTCQHGAASSWHTGPRATSLGAGRALRGQGSTPCPLTLTLPAATLRSSPGARPAAPQSTRTGTSTGTGWGHGTAAADRLSPLRCHTGISPRSQKPALGSVCSALGWFMCPVWRVPGADTDAASPVPCRASWDTRTTRTPGCSGWAPAITSSPSGSARYSPRREGDPGAARVSQTRSLWCLCWGPKCFLGGRRLPRQMPWAWMGREVVPQGRPGSPGAHRHHVCVPADAGAGGEALGHAAAQQGDAHRGAGHLSRVGTGTRCGAGGPAVGTPQSETHGASGGGAGGGRELLAQVALGHKAGDNAGDGMAASLAPLGWDGRTVAVLGVAWRCPQQRWSGAAPLWWLCWGRHQQWLVAAGQAGAGTGAAGRDAASQRVPLALLQAGAAGPRRPARGALCRGAVAAAQPAVARPAAEPPAHRAAPAEGGEELL